MGWFDAGGPRSGEGSTGGGGVVTVYRVRTWLGWLATVLGVAAFWAVWFNLAAFVILMILASLAVIVSGFLWFREDDDDYCGYAETVYGRDDYAVPAGVVQIDEHRTGGA